VGLESMRTFAVSKRASAMNVKRIEESSFLMSRVEKRPGSTKQFFNKYLVNKK
jgi:hypothetical protein